MDPFLPLLSIKSQVTLISIESSVQPPIWTAAQFTQATEIGWRFLEVGKGAGLIQGADGETYGSFVTLVSPNRDDYSFILETLEGKCLRCGGNSPVPRQREHHALSLEVGPGLPVDKHLFAWITNETNGGMQRAPEMDVPAGSSRFELELRKDTMVTLTTLNDLSRGDVVESEGVPASSRFQLPYADDFDGTMSGRPGRFWSDLGGVFTVVEGEEVRRGSIVWLWRVDES